MQSMAPLIESNGTETVNGISWSYSDMSVSTAEGVTYWKGFNRNYVSQETAVDFMESIENNIWENEKFVIIADTTSGSLEVLSPSLNRSVYHTNKVSLPY